MSRLNKLLQVQSDKIICDLINQHNVSELTSELGLSSEKLQGYCLLTNCEPCPFEGVIELIFKLESGRTLGSV
ncbi:hypothetical protein ACLVXC_004064 [Vibrio alginolyticus]|uniref:hypothetical protein n=1 Tax=Vibrio TaxID=662 RepID=UPI0005B55EFB|nr:MULTISPECIES: hypothetical protein [Vibrio]EJL6718360.1 hypothetical protein [Vibrio alginolyticus]KOE07657.1 hypothetical protein ACS83_02735 [Vibrio alginolyticus]MCS0170712.1 hypothetical protein [Vibrio alginolyticus]MDW2022081.1 hypothetical protein [Vibrio sp. 397]MDW2029135.1 hypothetical protein [Vibrio sp. 399]